MTDQQQQDRIRERWFEQMDEDFFPNYSRTNYPTSDVRLANAAEYAAYHLGQISKHLARIAAGFPAKK